MSEVTTSSKALKSGIWYVIGNFATKATGFLITPLFTRLLSKSDVGGFSNFVSWLEILTILFTFDLYSSVMIARFEFKEKVNNYIASNLVLGSTITVFFYIICLIFRPYALKILNFSDFELNMAFAYMIFYPASQMFLIKSRIDYKYKSYVALSVASAVISSLVSLLCVMIFSDRLIGRITGYYAPLIVINLLLYVNLLRQADEIKCGYQKYALLISLPLIWHTLAGNLLSSSDRIMITHFSGEENTALYSVAYYCALIVSVLWSSMNNAWSPWAYEQMNKENIDGLTKASKPYMLFFGAVVVCFLLMAPEILLLMGGKGYSSAIKVIPPIMVSVVFQFVYSLYVNIEFYHKKQVFIAIGTSAAAMVNIVLNLLFIPKFGYIAAAYTTLAGYVVLFCIHYAFVRYLGKEKWYDTKFVITYLTCFIFIMPAALISYQFPVFRGLIIFSGIILFSRFIHKNAHEIKEAVKEKSLSKIFVLLSR